MATISIPVNAFILALVRPSVPYRPGRGSSWEDNSCFGGTDPGRYSPSPWTKEQITQAFAYANDIWKREAGIEFRVDSVTDRVLNVPNDETGTFHQFINQLPPPLKKPGIGVGFVADLPGPDGGAGAGRIAVVSGAKAAEGVKGFAGSLLAHELGHVLIEDFDHALATGDPDNLMYPVYNPSVLNKGKLNTKQIGMAQKRAQALSTGSG